MYVRRLAHTMLLNRLKPGKVMILVGARRVGKTVLMNEIRRDWPGEVTFWNGEDFSVHEMVQRRSIQHYNQILGNTKLLMIDEAQHIPDVGEILKLMVDSFPQLTIFISGSSAFGINQKTGEPLTGRKSTVNLFSLAEQELIPFEKSQDRMDKLRQRLIFGNLPEVFSLQTSSEKAAYLHDLVNAYLLKDILSFENIRNATKLFNLLKLIAYQTGSEVSLEELGRQLALSKNTVERYLDLLSKSFVIYKLSGFSRNLRKEVTKSAKWYFFDNGIRNAIIANFAGIEQRNDIGLLWENYIINERLKHQHYSGMIVNNYFWRTYDQQEIDWVEDCNGDLSATEFKWQSKKVKIPGAWQKAYPNARFQIITHANFQKFLGITL